MTKGRTTTLIERIEIAGYCIANKYEYQGTADKFQVSYNQVYQWVKKFETGGEDALVDGRGRTKTEVELTDNEKLLLKVKQLENVNARLEAENLILKKLEMLERGMI